MVAIALQVAVPDRLVLVHPSWILPAAQGVLVVVLMAANPHRIDRQSRALRSLALMLAALLSLANGWSVARLADGIVHGGADLTAGRLLITGGAIWLTNVVAFALWYWEFDRGGPVEKALGTERYPDFQFVQMTSPPEMVPPDWEPAFVDYLYLAFTNATAFSPTDVMPMSRWAKVATALDGVDIDNPGTALDRSGHPNPVPRVVGPIRRRHAVEVTDLEFLRAHTSRTIKITLPGPFTMAQQAQDDYYGSKEALAFGYAETVNEEIRDLFAAGADIVQLDEPYLQARSGEAAKYGVKFPGSLLELDTQMYPVSREHAEKSGTS